MIRFYNTMTRNIEDFIPLKPGKVSMYVCGPTVYNYIHIGNARPMITFDTCRRYLEYKGFEVTYVSNFTDVDDKIIREAEAEGVSAKEIAERYIRECEKDMEALNVRPATVHPLATAEISGMIDMIEDLVKKGYAYAVNGTVYFRTRKFEQYGKLSHKNLDDLRSGSRELKVTGEEQKEDPLDFVLWKPKKEGEPSWESPWGDGRPGWHIECSVMAKRYLGDEIDIHAGGEDLIFPHHENEIAQSCCSNGVEFARYWLHNAFLNIDHHKMSKSLGNFKTVREICTIYDPQVLRFFMLSAHYRSPLNYSLDIMDSSKSALERITTAGGRLRELEEKAEGQLREDEQVLREELKKFRSQFEDAMDNDLNTADALAAIFDLVRFANTKVDEKNSKSLIASVRKELNLQCGILGLKAEKEEEDIEAWVSDKIQERQEARKARDFAKADAIRAELLGKGIVLEDTRDGVKWHRA